MAKFHNYFVFNFSVILKRFPTEIVNVERSLGKHQNLSSTQPAMHFWGVSTDVLFSYLSFVVVVFVFPLQYLLD